MTIPNAPIKNTNPPRPDYAWLERTRRTFQELGTNPDSAALEGIIAEGQARLAKVSPDDPLLAGYLRLTIAEAQLDLGLEQEDETERLEGFAAGRKNCEQAAQEALGAGCGVACNLLPRAITLLAALYRAAPQGAGPGLADSLQSIAAYLDEALLEQEYLRQKALGKLENARLLIASLQGLGLDERRAMLAQAATQLIESGELYLEAGDLEMTETVQTDLEALEAAYNDPRLPTPRLRLFEKPVHIADLLPGLDEDEEEVEEEDAHEGDEENRVASQLPVRLARPPARKRTSPLRWAISIGGLAISCLMMLCSGASLYNDLAKRAPAMGEESILYLTQTAFSAELTPLPQEVGPIADQPLANPNPPEPSQAPPVVSGISCPGAPASRLKVGEQAMVGDVGGYSLTIYAQPGYQAEELYYLEQDAMLTIIGGPTCIDNQLWWEINLDQGHTGWAPESSETGDYLLNP
jgi:hypothetical protein